MNIIEKRLYIFTYSFKDKFQINSVYIQALVSGVMFGAATVIVILTFLIIYLLF
jgi:hypothetical protein